MALLKSEKNEKLNKKRSSIRAMEDLKYEAKMSIIKEEKEIQFIVSHMSVIKTFFFF